MGVQRLPWSEHVARQKGVISRQIILLEESNAQEYLKKPHGDGSLDLRVDFNNKLKLRVDRLWTLWSILKTKAFAIYHRTQCINIVKWAKKFKIS
jgi:hypothetical protein